MYYNKNVILKFTWTSVFGKLSHRVQANSNNAFLIFLQPTIAPYKLSYIWNQHREPEIQKTPNYCNSRPYNPNVD